MSTIKQIKEELGIVCDQVTYRKNIFTLRTGFFYRHGKSSDDLASKVEKLLIAKGLDSELKIVDDGEHWTEFNGSASLSRSSHWFVKLERI